MKLIDISKNGTLKFKLSDGRFLLNYTSGYVRSILRFTNPSREQNK